jgi:hypothetical protein
MSICNGGDVNPGFGAGRLRSRNPLLNGGFDCAKRGLFDDPSAWQQLKAGIVTGGFDNVDGPVTEFGEGVTQAGAVVDAVSEEMAQPREQLTDGRDDEPGTTAILDIGRVHRGTDQQTASIGHNVALAAPGLRRGGPLTLLAASPRSWLCRARGQAQPRGPPLSVVLAD